MQRDSDTSGDSEESEEDDDEGDGYGEDSGNRDLARNEEFSEIAVINIFFTVLKTKTQLSVGGGGVLRGKF